MPPVNPNAFVFSDVLTYFHQTLETMFLRERAQRGRHMFADVPGDPSVCAYPMPLVLCDNNGKPAEESKWRVAAHAHNALVALAWELGFFLRNSEGKQLSQYLYFIECAGTVA